MSMQDKIATKLNQELQPIHLEVTNETHMHNVPSDAESHFKVVIVSKKFDGLALIKRHRMVNSTLAEEIKNIHALALHTYTPDQWFERSQGAPESPPCEGGSNT